MALAYFYSMEIRSREKLIENQTALLLLFNHFIEDGKQLAKHLNYYNNCSIYIPEKLMRTNLLAEGPKRITSFTEDIIGALDAGNVNHHLRNKIDLHPLEMVAQKYVIVDNGDFLNVTLALYSTCFALFGATQQEGFLHAFALVILVEMCVSLPVVFKDHFNIEKINGTLERILRSQEDVMSMAGDEMKTLVKSMKKRNEAYH